MCVCVLAALAPTATESEIKRCDETFEKGKCAWLLAQLIRVRCWCTKCNKNAIKYETRTHNGQQQTVAEENNNQ